MNLITNFNKLIDLKIVLLYTKILTNRMGIIIIAKKYGLRNKNTYLKLNGKEVEYRILSSLSPLRDNYIYQES